MSNYTADEIRDEILKKGDEQYYGEMTLFFIKGGVRKFKDTKMNIKADEEEPTAQRRDRGLLDR